MALQSPPRSAGFRCSRRLTSTAILLTLAGMDPWAGVGVIRGKEPESAPNEAPRIEKLEASHLLGQTLLQPPPVPQPPNPQPRRPQAQPVNSAYVVLGFNELGMHCMNQDFSQLCILPPFNTFRAQVIRRGREPRVVTSGLSVYYQIANNTTSVTKTNFWQFAPQLFGVNLPPDVGLTGHGLQGSMSTAGNAWEATGIPVTPIDDRGRLNPYPLGKIQVQSAGATVATTRAVVPVSWEISCNLCHAPGQPGPAVDADILLRHDQLHGTSLLGGGPVLCASCHADPALGTLGAPGVSSMSHAMHGAHANRMHPLQAMGLTNVCYACHPGFETNCQRDVHYDRGITCVQCHGNMADVAHPDRVPWVDEPTCASCHASQQEEFDFEEPGKLFKNSRGHGNVMCAACHGPPHAMGPAVTLVDNIQAIERQGYAGPISKCTVCHTTTPNEAFEHKRDD